MGKSNGRTIAVRAGAGARARKLTKVIGYGTQGFAVVMPYHRARSGFVGKIPVDYNSIGPFAVPQEDFIGFTADDRVKLSYHPDGFAQFSGETQGKIISGRDPITGEPKGVGLMTQPLSDPIRTGPSFSVAAWGLEDFEELSETDAAIVFEAEDMYFRSCTPTTANSCVLEVFVFPTHYWAATRQRGNDYVLTMAFHGFEASQCVIEMKVFDLPDQDFLLAGFVSHTAVSFLSKSGWVLGGPGNRDKSGKGHVLMGVYPRDAARFQDSTPLDRSESGIGPRDPGSD